MLRPSGTVHENSAVVSDTARQSAPGNEHGESHCSDPLSKPSSPRSSRGTGGAAPEGAVTRGEAAYRGSACRERAAAWARGCDGGGGGGPRRGDAGQEVCQGEEAAPLAFLLSRGSLGAGERREEAAEHRVQPRCPGGSAGRWSGRPLLGPASALPLRLGVSGPGPARVFRGAPARRRRAVPACPGHPGRPGLALVTAVSWLWCGLAGRRLCRAPARTCGTSTEPL